MTDSNIRCPNCSADIPVEVLEALQQIMITAFKRPQRPSQHIGIDNDCQVCHQPVVFIFEDPDRFFVYTIQQFEEMNGLPPSQPTVQSPSEN